MKTILLIFDESKVLDFISDNLHENGFIVYKAMNLKDGQAIAEKITLDVIVLDSSENENTINEFTNKLKQTSTVLKLVDVEKDLKKQEGNNYTIINTVRPQVKRMKNLTMLS